jgi:hypothetical protein
MTEIISVGDWMNLFQATSAILADVLRPYMSWCYRYS